MRKFVLAALVAALSYMGHAQTQALPLLVTNIFSISSTWPGECAAGAIDNRSAVQRQNDYHSVFVTSGTGNWTVAINFSDTSCTGPWSSFGSSSSINQGASVPIAFGIGNHSFIQIVITGNAVVTYAGSKNYFLSTAASSVSFPITVSNGGTGATSFTANGALYGNGTSTVQVTAAGSQYNVLTAGVSGTPAFGQVNLAQSAAVTGILAIANGGTNAATAAAALTNLGGVSLSGNNTFTGTNTFSLSTAFSAGLTSTTGGFTGALTTNITGGGIQCVHSSNTGVLTGTGSDCGAGGGSVPTPTGQLQYIRSKPNAGNVTTLEAKAFPTTVFYTSDFNFTAQQPGGTLTSGISANVTLTPCPLGVFGSSTVANGKPHLLYITGGSGTAEPVLIQGGTCAGDGVTTGTVTITPANSHAGAWAIQSDSTGVQECVIEAGNSGACQMPPGTITLWGNCPPGGTCNGAPSVGTGAINIPDGWGPSLRGTRSSAGEGLTFIQTVGTTGDWIVAYYASVGGAPIDLGDFYITDSAGTDHTLGAMVRVRYRSGGIVSNIGSNHCYDCFFLEADRGDIVYYNLSGNFKNRGIYVGCNGVSGASGCVSSGMFDTLQFANTASGSCIVIDTSVGTRFTHISCGDGATGANGIFLSPTTVNSFNEILIDGGFVDGYASGIAYSGSGIGCQSNGIRISNLRVAPLNYGFIAQGTTPCKVTITDSTFTSAGGNVSDAALNLISGADLTIADSQLAADGQYTVKTGGNLSGIALKHNVFGIEATSTVGCISLGAGTITGPLTIESNDMSRCSGVVADASTHTGTSWVANNTGIDSVISTVATASTLALPLNPRFSLTGATGVTTITVPLGLASFTWTAIPTGGPAFTAGATIGNSCTLTASNPYDFTWDGTHLWISGKGC